MKAWALTDCGMIRHENQDAYYFNVSDKIPVALVCDGMGGARAGNIASEIAANTFVENLRRPARTLDELLTRAVAEANIAVYNYGKAHPECYGMGTTLVAAAVQDGVAHIINVGDSRAYYITSHEIEQITQDHSLVADLVRKGTLTPEQARNHPRKNLITRALGTEGDIDGDIFEVEMAPGSMLLLCSDGLSNMVSDQEILYEAVYGGSISSCCERLMNIALNRGAPDNVTLVLLKADSKRS